MTGNDGTDGDWLAARFEEQRPRLRAVAHRMLGSESEADDAVQETWLRLSRAGADGVDNLAGWLTTVVSRVALNMLRSRGTRREEPLELHVVGADVADHAAAAPEQEALIADAIGPALLLVLDALTPAERVAFVLHDLFGVPFEEIAPVVERSPQATRQLASRARRRIRGGEPGTGSGRGDARRRQAVVDAFLAASRDGDLTGLLRVLAPDVVLRADAAAVAMGVAPELRGARAVAGRFSGGARALRRALVDGAPGLVWSLRGEPKVVFSFTVDGGRITGIEQIGDAGRIAGLALEFLGRATGG